MAAVLPLGTNETVAGSISTPGELDEFQVTLADSGRLTVEVQTRPGCSLDTRTSLLGPDDQLLIQSDGQSLTNRDDLIVQHLLAGTYLVKVEGLRGGTGDYTLTTQFEPANPPNEPLLVDFPANYPFAITPRFSAVGDFNSDGHPDIVTANIAIGDVSLLLGLGDGTFQTARNFAVGARPFGVVAADFNGDGKLDLAVANAGSGDVSILLGRGDGTFAPQQRVPGGHGATGLVAGDLNGDGNLDLVAANTGSNDVSVLLGRGDGTFQPEVRYATGLAPSRLALGDFNGDGHLDLAAGNLNSNDLSVLLGRGDGTFRPEVRYATGENPIGVIARDFNGDGHLDLAVSNSGSNDVSLLLGRGDGTFRSAGQLSAGTVPFHLVAGDFNGDGYLDLATANIGSHDVSVLLGRGDGTFQDQPRYRAGLQPRFILAADFDGDGHLDLATANSVSHDVSILLGLGDGTFQPDLTDPRPGRTYPLGMVTADFNRDGILDLATVSFGGGALFVSFGRGDGTSQEPVAYPVGSTPVELVAADFNGDGILDLATANCNSGDAAVLLGRGDGSFQPAKRFPASTSAEFIVTGDFNGDGKLDLITGGQFASGLAVLLGNGDGTFQKRKIFAPGYEPADGAVGDFNGDGKLDLAATNLFSPDHDVLIFLGNGDGTFQEPPRQIPVGSGPLGILADDFNRDGKTDLAVANYGSGSAATVLGASGAPPASSSGSGSVSILLGNGDGTFRTADPLVTGAGPDFLVAADFNADGQTDLAVGNSLATDLSVFLGQGDGTFQAPLRFPTGDRPTSRRGLIAGDFNGDGRLDLAATEMMLNDVAILPGSGDGTFRSPLRFPLGLGPVALTTGDYNNDGRLDVASVNPTTNELTVSLGLGDATLQGPVRLAVGAAPVAVVRGDFNRDGRLDLAAANYSSGDVSVVLGLGDGTFRQQRRFAVGTNPVAVIASDFNGDGLLDLATANAGSKDLSILLSRGDGTFQSPLRLPAGDLPQALVTGDFNGDRHADLVVADYRSQDVRVYFGRGDGTFANPVRYALGTAPVSLVAGDLNEDGILDLATANYLSNDVSVLLGRRDGTFWAPVRFEAGTNPVLVVVSDLDDDGHADLATADSTSQDVSILLGRGDGTFAASVRRSVGDYAVALAGADFTDDGHTDLALVTQLSPEVSILQGLGDLRFVPGGTISNPIHATPLVVDFNGDGLPDVAVVSRQGKVLLRLARPNASGVFEAPLIVNPDPDPAARALAVLFTPQGQRLAALDARSPSLSFYKRQPDGTFTRTPGPMIRGTLPVALAAGDLNGDGLTDLVVADAGSDEVLVYLQIATGGFGPREDYELHVGVSPSALILVDGDGDGRLDIVVTNQFSGDVSVLRNEGNAGFASESRFRAGTGLYWLDSHDGQLAVRSRLAPAGVVAGRFDADGFADLIVTNSGVNRFALLRGDGAGGFRNPEQLPPFATGLRPTAVVAARFTSSPSLDLAVLNEESGDISIFLGDGHGSFTEKVAQDANGRKVRLNAGYLPTGLTAYDSNRDGKLDLLVGNDFGDVLLLLGNGDGTFQPYQRAGRHVALAVADLNGDGQDDFVFGNESRDRVTVQYSRPGQTFTQERTDGVLAPGAVSTADLDRDGWLDLVIANGGANNVLVYLGSGGGQFEPARSFFTGTNPAGVNVQDLDRDGWLDLVVANEGSNDVTILLGAGQGGDWTLTPGPRLRLEKDTTGDGIPDVFGVGPASVTARDVTGDGVSDLAVSNSQSDNVFVLPGVGGGFFNDQNPLVFDTAAAPRQALVGNFDARPGLDLVTVNAGSNSLTFFSDFTAPDTVGINIASGGLTPVAALAGDFNGDGLADLVVANNGDGAVSLFLGREDGLSLEGFRFLADLPHPTALALAGTEGGLEVYVAGENAEAVHLLSFSPDVGPIALATAESLRFPGSGRGQVADLLPLQDTTLAAVAVLLTVRLESESLPARLEQEVAAGRGGDPGAFARLLPERAAEQPGGAEEAGRLDAEGPGDLPAARDALLELVTGREEERAGRPPLTREEVLNPTRPAPPGTDTPAIRQRLDEWMPGAAAILDAFWTSVADGGLRLWETSAAALHTTTAPLRAAEKLLPAALPLREVVDGVAEALLEAVRSAAEATGDRLAPAWEATPPLPEGPGRPKEQPGREMPEGVSGEGAAPAAALVAALFALGWYRAARTHPVVAGRRAERRDSFPPA